MRRWIQLNARGGIEGEYIRLQETIQEVNPNARFEEARPENWRVSQSDVNALQVRLSQEVTNASSRAINAGYAQLRDMLRAGNTSGLDHLNLTPAETQTILNGGNPGIHMHHIRNVAQFPTYAGQVTNLVPLRIEQHVGPNGVHSGGFFAPPSPFK
jgi:hypothetical protein